MRVRVLHHDHCFDGAASAAFVTRFLQSKFYPGADFVYTGLAHRADQLFEDGLFDGDINVIVDFKYSTHPNLTWWFDHHQSAFLSAEDAEHFRHDKSGRKMFDPSFRSCTKFIAHIAETRFGYSAPDLDDLVKWADIVDGALYESAEAAVELHEPAMKLTLVIERRTRHGIVEKIIRAMQHQPLREIMAEPEIEAEYNHLRSARSAKTSTLSAKPDRAIRASFTSILSITALKATTNSSLTTCSPIPRIPFLSPPQASGPRCQSAQIPGYASLCGITWRASASGMAEAGIQR